ncbi:hypothetical protein CCR85_10075 [Rhodothalassium salexigens]|uniref:Ppx/GppA phosphatase family protein n=1 Tax=Rhodothalassium salexigens TaxID=1086 RepID=UPI0019113687|nr:Ppx/GppA phosphatase family protein [Rhodothalassium salexigens]MBK5911834.1 hypothetical protein [Rhodothalassium salexigens]MBK5922068.1 hypothetical protein [Rhodothalassium salexigens]
MLDALRNAADGVATQPVPGAARGRGDAAPVPGRIAVFDVGSNSVRMVVFDALRRHPMQMFNEKAMCGLGRAVGKTGAMDEDAMAAAVAALRRFAGLLGPMQVEAVVAVATAAVREASNGAAFIERVRAETEIALDVIPGEEEARLAALGVIAGTPEATGIVGDLGGGSLELMRVAGADGLTDRVTLPIGPVRLIGDVGDDMAAQARLIDEALDGVSWLSARQAGDFYIVGGAWRAIARLHMAQNRWPLGILHGYTLPGRTARDFAHLLSRQHPQGLRGTEAISQRRLDVLPTAALILAKALERMKPDRLVTSSFGLREGLVFDRLPPALQAEDPFLSECRKWAETVSRFPLHAETLMTWLDPVFAAGKVIEDDEHRRLRFATCLLADISWRGHPDFRAERAVMEVLYGRFVGIDHRGRALIAMALLLNYGGSAETGLARTCRRLLSDDDVSYARLLGLALRLAQRLSGGTEPVLRRSGLKRTAQTLTLRLDPAIAALSGEMVERRLKRLADALDLTPEMIVSAQQA